MFLNLFANLEGNVSPLPLLKIRVCAAGECSGLEPALTLRMSLPPVPSLVSLIPPISTPLLLAILEALCETAELAATTAAVVFKPTRGDDLVALLGARLAKTDSPGEG